MNPKTLQVSCVQMHWGKELEENLSKTLKYIKIAANEGSRVVCFPEANITGYHFPHVLKHTAHVIETALDEICNTCKKNNIWAIVGTLKPTYDRLLNLAHVISPEGYIVHEYAKIHLAGENEKKYCRSGNKLSFFYIDEIPCTLAICRDGRHPEVYRIPAMAGAQILFQPSCSSDEIEIVHWKRISGRAQLPAGPTTQIFHCVANTVGQSPDGSQSSSGSSFIKDTTGLSIIEADYYHEDIITAILNLNRADRTLAIDSLNKPLFLKSYWEEMISEMLKRTNERPV